MADVAQIVGELRANPSRYKDAGTNAWLPAADVARLLTTGDAIPNPTPQGTVDRPIDLEAALNAMTQESLVKLVNTPLMSDFIAACKANDNDSAKRLIMLGVRTGQITQAEAAALLALNGEMPDPAWQATVTGPPPLPSVSLADVEAALTEVQQ